MQIKTYMTTVTATLLLLCTAFAGTPSGPENDVRCDPPPGSVGDRESPYRVASAAADPSPPPMPPAPAPTPSPTPKPDVPPVKPSVTVPKTVTVKTNHIARVAMTYVGDDLKWWTDDLNEALDVFREYDPTTPNSVVLRIAGEDGVYQLHAVAASVVSDKAVLSPVVTCVITIGTPKPPTPGPTPPGPTPPVPPNPTPAPIPGEGLRVMILFDQNKETPETKYLIEGTPLAKFLDGKTVLGKDGKTHEWRVWPSDADPTGDDPEWAAVLKRPHASLPWLVVGNGKTGFEGPLPTDEAAFEATVSKYAQ